jgi:hypothetical protein
VQRMLNSSGAVVSCNYRADDVFNYRKLCGHTNVQGRHVNGGTDTCHQSVDRGTGRFVHLEQDWHVLRAYSAWGRLYDSDWPKAILDSFLAVMPGVSKP